MQILRLVFRFTLIAIFIGLLTWTCDKEVVEPGNNDTIPEYNDTIPEYNRSEILVIGDTSNTLFIDFDSLLINAEPGTTESYEIDIDKDGSNDIKLTAHYTVAPSGGWSSSEIECLDSTINLSVHETYDTSFNHFHIDTFYWDWVQINLVHIWSCRRIDTSDTIRGISNVVELSLHETGDTISIENMWFSDKFKLWRSNNEDYAVISETLDTVKVQFVGNIIDCDNFPLRPVYLGLKQQKNGETRLGWMKIRNHRGYEITVYETAIQK